jgi:hypothetical protein
MRPYTVASNPVAATVAIAQAAPVESIDEVVTSPSEFSLGQNYPNPFNPSTEIRFTVPEDSHVRLVLYNAIGQEVRTLVDANAPAGYHAVKLDASSLPSGPYFYRMSAGTFSAVKRMLLVK